MIFFFLRSYNDIDHIIPIIDKWAISKGLNFKVIILDPFLDYLNDYRFQYLKKEHGIEPESILDYCEIPLFLIKRIKVYNSTKKIFLDRILHSLIWRYVLKQVSNVRADRMLNKLNITRKHKGALVFDHNKSELSARIIQEALTRNWKSVALPHGISNFQNMLYLKTSLEVEDNNRSAVVYNDFNKVFFCDSFTAQKAVNRGMDEKLACVLGSVRYSSEWMKKFEEKILPQVNLPFKVPDGHIKVLLFLTKEKNNVFEEEIIRSIEYILKFQRIFLIVKPHTRKMKFNFALESGNLWIDHENEIPSSSLINWSDLVLFTASSVVLECLRKDKPVLFLRKAIYNKVLYEKYIQSWDIECRDDLRAWLCKFIENKNQRTYTKDSAEKCLNELVDAGHSETVMQRYVDEISKCF